MKDIYEIEVKPNILEIDEIGEIQFSPIIDYLQLVAYEHASNLGISFHQTYKEHLTWFLLRYYIEMKRYPLLEEKLVVRSWVAPSDNDRFTLREFQILDKNAEVICSASSSWILYHFIKRKQVDHLKRYSHLPIVDLRAVDYNFPKLALPEKTDSKVQFIVRLSDLDLNEHVNNRVYVEWAIESMPKKYLKKYKISKIEISFKGQAFHQNTVTVETEIKKAKEDGIEFIALHKISDAKKGNLLTKLISYWRKKK